MTEALPEPPAIRPLPPSVSEAPLKGIETIAPLPAGETGRLEALRRYNILDTPPEAAFDRLTSLAARLFDVPTTLISLVDESRGWFKSAYGFDRREIQRDATLCSFALLSHEVLVVPDTRQDDRFACNPFVQSEPGLRFYAGAPLITHDGFNLGTLCLLDTKPRDTLTEQQKATLADLAAMVVDELELRLAARKITQIDAALLAVTQGVSTTTGEAFFYALVQHFTKVLGVDHTYIGLVSGDDQEVIQTIAACAHGQIIDNFTYLLRETPCQEVIQQKKLCCYPKDVKTLFPNASVVTSLGLIESFIAIPFFDSNGVPLGILSVIDGKPLENSQVAEALLTVFALRIATELERQHTEAVRQQVQHDLEQLVEQRTIALSRANELLQLEVTERHQAEVALQKEQEMLKVLLDNVQVGIVACNAEGILTLFNRSAREFHNLPEQPLPPEQWADYYDLYLPDGKTQMPKEKIPLFRALQGEPVNNVEMVIAPKQKLARTLLASGQAIVDPQGNRQGAVVVMHDITERKQAEIEHTQLMQRQIQEQTARLKAEADQRRSAFLAEVSTMLASSLDYEQTLASVADLVVPFFADWCAIDLLQDHSINRVAVAHRDPEKVILGWQLHQQYPRPIDGAEGVPKVLRTGEIEMAAEISDAALANAIEDAEYLQILQTLGLKSCIISPLIARGQILGAISFVTAESNRRYSQADLALVEDIAHRAAIAIDNAQLYREAQRAQQAAERSAERITRLQSVTAAFSESLTPIQVAEVIMDQGIAALGANFALVALLDETGTELEVVRMVGWEPDQLDRWRRFPLTASVPLAEAVRTGQPLWAESSAVRAARYPHLAENYEQKNFGSWISLPLIVESRAVGGMSFGFTDPQQLDEQEQTFILSLAQQCAQAIARTYLYEAERIARSAAVREAARSAEANRIKDEFLAVLSHELRSPLNPILGWSSLLRSGRLDAAKTAYALEIIERNAKLQVQLIEDLLDVSRILQGKLSLNPAPIDLATTIQSALETVRLAAEAKGTEVQFEISDTAEHPLPIQVLGDAARLQQVVWNLLTNAIKFTPAGGRVNIRLERLIDKQAAILPNKPVQPSTDYSLPITGFAQIVVSDTGKGIPSSFLLHVFDRFRQADSTTTRQFGGLGLGLAIVRHLVELHGGTVQAESAGEGQGATFTVRLPLIKPESSRIKGEENPTLLLHHSSPLAGVRVLLVDDDADARDLVTFILEQAGAIATGVESVSEALKIFPHLKLDVLVSDIGMPQLDGYGLIRQIRAMPSEQGGQLPAVALTAYAGEVNQQQVLASGFQMHIAKPIEPDVLVQAIVTLVRQG